MTGIGRQWWPAIRAAHIVWAVLIPAVAGAGDLSVDPVRIELSPQQQVASVNIRNNSDQPTTIQIEATAWSQLDGKDVYTPTRELLVSPPIITIAPKSEQVIRSALRRKADTSTELTYRIYLQELPSQPVPGFKGVQVTLRIGLPVFVKPQKLKATPKMLWTVSAAPDNSLKVALQNQGSAHVQVSDFALYDVGNDKPIGGESGLNYILAGQMHEWLIKTDPSKTITGGSLRLTAHTDAGNVDIELPVGTP